ncbi:MAG: tRNA pseudouridine(38-40) synthase TruA [Brevinematales bacterium]|nr:tRNA pseudouridine(38-40) synthase TruA [Brevinematales bacterium]
MVSELKNIKIKLAYDGSKFNGWQKHKENDNSVEATLIKAIKNIINEEIVLYAASRTDKGVHALGQIVNFRTYSDINLSEFKQTLRNSLEHIYIINVEYVPTYFHSRQFAIGKKYIYQIWNSPKIDRKYYPYCWHLKEKLNLELMEEYKNLFIGKKDFKNLSRSDKKDTVRNVFDIKIKNFYPLLLIEITGESFLYNMIRCIVGNLVLLAYRKISEENSYKKNLIAPAEGLFLEKIYY